MTNINESKINILGENYIKHIHGFGSDYQEVVSWFRNDPTQHNKSRAIVEILIKNNLIYDNMKIFEIGCASARNLTYIYNENNNIKLFGNDLHKIASYANMHKKIKEIITFYEIDTLSVVKNNLITDIDLLLSIDHIMHIPPDETKEIIEIINSKWQPKYILFKECTIPRAYNQPKYCHNIEFNNYELIYNNEQFDIPTPSYLKIWKFIEIDKKIT